MNKDITAVRALLDKIQTEAADAEAAPTAEYEIDILAWTEQQAALLRQRSANALDWDNIAEEIEAVGRHELRTCKSLLRQAMRHMLKAQAWPDARDASTWRADAEDFREQAAETFTPSMRQKIDLAALYARERARLPTENDGQAPTCSVAETCPWSLDQLLGDSDVR
jgi:Domain of unknown function DUF29